MSITLFARALIFAGCGLLFWAVAPAAIGWQSTVTVSGSMTPRIQVGDVVVSRPVSADRLRPGMVLLVDDPSRPGALLVHRLVGRTSHGALMLRGDANRVADTTVVQPDRVRGVAVLRVPRIGLAYVWWYRGDVPALCRLAVLVVLAVLLAGLHRNVPGSAPGPGTPPSGPAPPEASAGEDPRAARTRRLTDRLPRPRGRGTPVRNRIVVPVTVLLATGLALPLQAASSAYTGKTTNPTNTLTTAYFSCTKAVVADSPVLFYTFNETSGTSAADSSGHSDVGTYAGGVTQGVARACASDTGTAITLDGTSGYVYNTTQYTSPQTFTLEIWFKTTSTTGGFIAGFGGSRTGGSGTYDRHIYLSNDGGVNFGVYNGGFHVITTPGHYNDGAWHLVDATFSASTGTRLYLDGALIVSDSTSTVAENTTGYWRFGYNTIAGWTNTGSNYFTGSLDNAALYTTVLSATAIARHYAAKS